MIGHAAAAEWLKTLPWWDWRGWSDWFYGGQAIGVNYPPLGHAWMRFTHPGPRADGSGSPRAAGASAMGRSAFGAGGRRLDARRGLSALRWGRYWC